MAGIKGKLSQGIVRDIETARRGVVRVVIHRSCPQCIWHLYRRNIHIEQELPLIGAYVAEVPRRMIPILAEKSYIKFIEHDAKVVIHMDTARETVLAESFKRDTGLTGRGVTIACVDTGVNAHPDLTLPTNRITAFVDMVSGEAAPYDDNGHGTFCMGCAGGNGRMSGGQYAGVASEAGLIMIKALDKSGNATISVILKAMQWVSDNASKYNIRVLSMSLGVEPGELSHGRDTLAEAAEAIWSQGVVVVAAAGNSGPREGTINSPGTAESVITVGAVNDRAGPKHLEVAAFSSRSLPGGRKPDILAPGVNIVSLSYDSSGFGYTTMSGTSMSAPIVAGCAALLIERDGVITPDTLKAALLRDAYDLGLPANVQGRGVVQMR